jgi:hypothetical protein
MASPKNFGYTHRFKLRPDLEKPLVGLKFDENDNVDFGMKRLTRVNEGVNEYDVVNLKQLNFERKVIMSDYEDSLNKRTGLVDEKVIDIEKKIVDHQVGLEANVKSITEIDNVVKLHKNKIDEYETRILDNTEKVDNLAGSFKTVCENKEILPNIGNMNEHIENIKTGLELNIDANKQETDKLKRDISNLNIHTESMDSNINSLNSKSRNMKRDLNKLKMPSFTGYHVGRIMNESKLAGKVIPDIPFDKTRFTHAVINQPKFTGTVSNLDDFPDVIKVQEDGTFLILKHCRITYYVCFTRFDGTPSKRLACYILDLEHDHERPKARSIIAHYIHFDYLTSDPTYLTLHSIEPMTLTLAPNDVLELKEYIGYFSFDNDDTKLIDCNADFWFKMEIDQIQPYEIKEK